MTFVRFLMSLFRSVILSAEKNLPIETLRGVYPERSRRAQGDTQVANLVRLDLAACQSLTRLQTQCLSQNGAQFRQRAFV
jgi:hypothetical protein